MQYFPSILGLLTAGPYRDLFHHLACLSSRVLHSCLLALWMLRFCTTPRGVRLGRHLESLLDSKQLSSIGPHWGAYSVQDNAPCAHFLHELCCVCAELQLNSRFPVSPDEQCRPSQGSCGDAVKLYGLDVPCDEGSPTMCTDLI